MSVSLAPHLGVFEQTPPPQTRIAPAVDVDGVVHHVRNSERPDGRLVDVVARSRDLLFTGTAHFSACYVDHGSAGLHADLLLAPPAHMRGTSHEPQLELGDGATRGGPHR